MRDAGTLEAVRKKYDLLQPLMTERLRRQWAACEAETLGRGGVRLVALATGLSRTTIWAGRRELRRGADHAKDDLSPERIRAPGGGRHLVEDNDPAVVTALQTLVEATTHGVPEAPLRWTSKSTRHLAEQMRAQGHAVSHQTVAALLDNLGYSLQAKRKNKEGKGHPDQDAQFAYINQQVQAFQQDGQPVVSVDSRNKKWMEEFRDVGQESHPRGQPEAVRAPHFAEKHLAKAILEGVHDLRRNEGWVSVGIDHDTAAFAADSLRRWWQEMGSLVYPHAQRLLITADAAGSHGCRSSLWQLALQGLADELGLRISVCHVPPATSKWNKIEHRMFCHTTKQWRGKPLYALVVVVNLIANTNTKPELYLQTELDPNVYETCIEVSAEELAAVHLETASFQGEWNYTIASRV